MICGKECIIMKDIERNAICMIVMYIVLWYAGAMIDFFPFIGDDAVGFTGLLIVIVIVMCTCWIIDTIRKQGR